MRLVAAVVLAGVVISGNAFADGFARSRNYFCGQITRPRNAFGNYQAVRPVVVHRYVPPRVVTRPIEVIHAPQTFAIPQYPQRVARPVYVMPPRFRGPSVFAGCVGNS